MPLMLCIEVLLFTRFFTLLVYFCSVIICIYGLINFVIPIILNYFDIMSVEDHVIQSCIETSN